MISCLTIHTKKILFALLFVTQVCSGQVNFDNVRLGFQPKGGVLSVGILGENITAGELVKANEFFAVQATNPDVAPTGLGYGCAISADKEFAYFGGLGLNHVVYKRNSCQQSYRKVDLYGITAGTSFDAAFSSDGSMLVISGNFSATEKFYSFKWSETNDRFEKTAAASGNIPSNTAFHCGLSADGTRLAVGNAYDTTPGVRRLFSYVWSEVNNRFEETAAPDIEPDDRTYGLTMSGDGNFIAVCDLSASPYLYTYKWSSGNNRYEKTANANTDSAFYSYDMAMSNDGGFLALGMTGTPYLRSYKWSAGNNRYEVTTAPNVLPSGQARGIGMSTDGSVICVGSSGATDNVRNYLWDAGDNRYEVTASATLTILTNIRGAAMSGDGKTFVMAHESSNAAYPYFTVFYTNTPNNSYQIVKHANPIAATGSFSLNTVFFGYLKKTGVKGSVQPMFCNWWRERGASLLDMN
jgi:hypothetical protein